MLNLTPKTVFFLHLLAFAFIIYVVHECTKGGANCKNLTYALYTLLAIGAAYHYGRAYGNPLAS